jgi:hypothetical protein
MSLKIISRESPSRFLERPGIYGFKELEPILLAALCYDLLTHFLPPE